MLIIDRIKQFQDKLVAIGVARNVLALPAPKILSLPNATATELENDLLFDRLIDEHEIVNVARDLFDSGHFNIAVHESFKVVDNFVRDKVGETKISGTNLMNKVFSPDKPILAWSKRKNRTQKDEQEGYHRLFSGSMLGIRNPTGHEFDWVTDADTALECICFAQHLLKKAKQAMLTKSPIE